MNIQRFFRIGVPTVQGECVFGMDIVSLGRSIRSQRHS